LLNQQNTSAANYKKKQSQESFIQQSTRSNWDVWWISKRRQWLLH